MAMRLLVSCSYGAGQFLARGSSRAGISKPDPTRARQSRLATTFYLIPIQSELAYSGNEDTAAPFAHFTSQCWYEVKANLVGTQLRAKKYHVLPQNKKKPGKTA